MKRQTQRHLWAIGGAAALILVCGLTDHLLRGTPPIAPVGCTAVSFDTLRSWDYVEGKTPIPEHIQKLDGRYVQMTGFMMPLAQTRDISEFILVPYVFGCCYGAPLAPNHMVIVQMPYGKTTQPVTGPFTVRGTFHSGEIRRDGALLSLYRLDAQEIVTRN